MAKKILIAIDNDFMRETYAEVFMDKDFGALKAKNGKEALDLAKKEKPDIILADVTLSEIDGFELLKSLKKEDSTKKIPVIIFAQFEREKDRRKAIELEAKDFVTAAKVTPLDMVGRAKIALGEQKSYRIAIQKNFYNAKELISDFGYSYDLKCPECGSDLVLYLIRDLSKGENYFKASFICPECD
jgi:two-component system cell cycle response regulator DivK